MFQTASQETQTCLKVKGGKIAGRAPKSPQIK